MQIIQRHMERYIFGIEVKDKVKIWSIREKTKARDIACTIKKVTGHLARMKGEEKWVKKLIEWIT